MSKDHVDNISRLQERSVTIPCYRSLNSSGSRRGAADDGDDV